jgi:hypothetical protein
MTKRTFALTGVGVALVGLLAAASTQAAWAPLTRVNHLTFSGAVRLPNTVLTPGTYTFEAGPNGTDLDIVRVTTRDGQKVLFQGFTIPVSRMSNGPIVSLGEAAAGAPQPIAAWYEGGSTRGHQFQYR